MPMSLAQLEDLAEEKTKQIKKFLAAEPPAENGESLLALWDEIYDDQMKSIVVDTVTGPSDDEKNPVFPYEKLQAIVGDGGNWKWPRMWQRLDELERRGPAFREGEVLNFSQPNKNPHIVAQRILVVGSGPVGLRMAIELKMGGHEVTMFEKRRQVMGADGQIKQLGFTNRINRPHMWPFVRNDLARLNGKDFMSRQACYPVFTEPDTSSIGIDELQLLLIKNAVMLGVDIRLGVGYDNAKVRTDPQTMKPTWEIECTYDEQAAAKYGKTPGKNTMVVDVLIGCDGPRSTVRDTQQKHFGEITKRKFMDCIGIVANVRKVERKRLKELGFPFGQEPNDMNRTKMVFKDFFQKINEEAAADLESIIYYKASFHNYCILTPKRANLIEHGMTEPVYHFAAARNATEEKTDAKTKLKTYCTKVLKSAGIPVDDTKENGGFVDPPNDCMAFDFAECWNTPKGITFNLPPPTYDVATDGEWQGRRLVPVVALAGDALLEPFWPMGLGLKRGWQALMDTCYAVDNLYNAQCFIERKKADPAKWTWDNHFEALQEQIAVNFENCNRLKVAEELGKGEYKDDGVVMRQLKKLCKDAERPCVEPEIDPWTRYAPLEKEEGDAWKIKMKDDKWIHPKVQKLLKMKEFYDKMGASKTGEVKYEGKKLLSVGGQTVGGGGGGGGGSPAKAASSPAVAAAAKPAISQPAVAFKPPQRRPSQIMGSPLASLPKEAIAEKAEDQRQKLANAVMAARIEDHVKAKHDQPTLERMTSRRASHDAQGGIASLMKSMPAGMDKLGHMAPAKCGDSVAEASEAMWNQMTGKNLSPAEEAELQHIRNMITALSKSLDGYKRAEQELLMKGGS